MFTNKSLDTILGTFNKVTTDLTNFIERTTIEHDQHVEKVAFHEAQVSAKIDDIARANSVKEKIANLIN